MRALFMRFERVRIPKPGRERQMKATRATCVLSLAITCGLFAAFPSYAGCPDRQYESCFLGACACFPMLGGDIGRGAEHLKNEIKGQVAGPVIEGWIRQSRNDAMRGALPIPPHIRRALTGYASESSMNRVRYKIGDNGVANLAHVTFQLGWENPRAITLDDVVVFRGPSEANDIALWAHELVHVDQYSSWGIRDFAIRYARNNSGVEEPGYAKERGYAHWARSRGTAGGGHRPFGPTQPPPNLGAFCYTPFGRFGPGPFQPVGSHCWVPTNRGPIYGQVGR